MSEFARKQLEKYGWSEGKGLGKEENGIVKPIRTILKFDNQGVGHDSSKVWTSRWWCDVFNDASKRISVTNNKTGVQVHCEKKVIESSLPSNLAIHKNFIRADSEDCEKLPSLDEDQTNSSLLTDIRHDSIYRKCDGMKEKCFNYSLMKGKINRVRKQEEKFLKRSKKMKKFNAKKSKNTSIVDAS